VKNKNTGLMTCRTSNAQMHMLIFNCNLKWPKLTITHYQAELTYWCEILETYQNYNSAHHLKFELYIISVCVCCADPMFRGIYHGTAKHRGSSLYDCFAIVEVTLLANYW